MHVSHMAYESGELIEVENPSLGQILDAIQVMDGHNRSQVVLRETDSDECGMLGIGGGKDDLLFCILYDEDGCEHALIDPSCQQPDEIVSVMCLTEVKRQRFELVPRAWVFQAVKTFVETGRLDDQYTWEKTC